MYEEKVRKFKCYYCPDCNLYAGSETKTIHGRRMKPNTKYCTGGKKIIIFRSDDPKVNVPNGVLSGVCRPHCGFTTSVHRKSRQERACLRPTGFRFSHTPAAMQCGMRESHPIRRWILQGKLKASSRGTTLYAAIAL